MKGLQQFERNHRQAAQKRNGSAGGGGGAGGEGDPDQAFRQMGKQASKPLDSVMLSTLFCLRVSLCLCVRVCARYLVLALLLTLLPGPGCTHDSDELLS